MNYRKLGRLLVAALAMTITATSVRASDHDDGESDLKGRALNLTDLYAFREDKEISGGSNAHIIFLINSNPRSLPRQQYYFSTQAHYDLHISRAGTSTGVAMTTADNVIIRLTFAAPDSNKQQAITMTTIIDGVSTAYTTKDGGGAILTTPLGMAATPINSSITANGQAISVFAGLRKDPFFFDVTAFFQFRAAAAAVSGNSVPTGYSQFTGTPNFIYTPDASGGGNGTASDFTANYNVNTIGLRVPIAFLQKNADTVFDTWTTVSVPQ